MKEEAATTQFSRHGAAMHYTNYLETLPTFIYENCLAFA